MPCYGSAACAAWQIQMTELESRRGVRGGSMRVLIIGSDNPWRMEAAIERALRRAGHVPRLFDDRRMRRLVGFRLTQVVTREIFRRFRPDFVILSKCHALALETVAFVVRGVPS